MNVLVVVLGSGARTLVLEKHVESVFGLCVSPVVVWPGRGAVKEIKTMYAGCGFNETGVRPFLSKKNYVMNCCPRKMAILIKGHGPGGPLSYVMNYLVAKNFFIFTAAGDCCNMVNLLRDVPNCRSKQ